MHLAHSLALGALFAASVIAPAHAQTPQAFYPLISDLLDATTNYGPITLGGTPPPSAPNNGVCVNGIYLFGGTGGQDVRTPVIVTFDQNDFQLDFEFNLTTLPTTFQKPVLMGGNGWRFIGLYVQANGTLGLKYNNSNFTWSTTTVSAGPWYTASIRYEQGNVEVHLNGALVHTATLGALNTNNNFNFTTNDFSNGGSHHGCIRNLLISNDTTLGATATPYGTGCDGLGLAASGLPSIGNSAFALLVTNVPTVSPIAFVGFGSAAVNPGVDLGVIGMAGCFAYTSLDLGLFGPVGVAAGTASFPLAIPPNPSLVGAQLAAQGASLSAATTLGLASSNGLLLTIAL